jgi:hypothetical protein
LPTIASVAYGFGSVREFMFRTVSQTTLTYKDSSVSEGEAGKVKGGDRLPWVEAAGSDNYEPLRKVGWQVHVYGTVHDDLRAWSEKHGVELNAFAWAPEYKDAGFEQNAAYLLRPDTYIAFAASDQSITAIDGYLAGKGFTLAR